MLAGFGRMQPDLKDLTLRKQRACTGFGDQGRPIELSAFGVIDLAFAEAPGTRRGADLIRTFLDQ